MASILNLTNEELDVIIQTGVLPEGVDLEGIEAHPKFSKLFAVRTNPAALAVVLRGRRTGMSTSPASNSDEPRNPVGRPPINPNDRKPTYTSTVDPSIHATQQRLREETLRLKAEALELRKSTNSRTYDKLAGLTTRITNLERSTLQLLDRMDELEALVTRLSSTLTVNP